jgi:O-antigen ligase
VRPFSFFLKPTANLWLLGMVVVIPFAWSTHTLDAYHSWRWSLLALTTTLGLTSFGIGRKKTVPLSASPWIFVAVGLAAALGLASLLSVSSVYNWAEYLWQNAQTLTGLLWFFLALLLGTAQPEIWVIVRRLAVTSALLGALFAMGSYWSWWSWLDEAGWGPGGLHGNRNLFASFQFLLCPWVIWGLIAEQGFLRLLALAAWVAYAYALAITQCRAAWLATVVFAICSLVLIFFTRPHATKPSPRSLGILAFLLLAPIFAFSLHAYLKPGSDTREGNWERTLSITDTHFDSNALRLSLWKKTLELIRLHPITGVGAGQWKLALPSRGLAGLGNGDMSAMMIRPHNDWLWIAAETGLLGAFAAIALPMLAFLLGCKKSLSSKPIEIKWPLILLSSGLLGYMVLANFDFPRERAEHATWYALMLAALFTLSTNSHKKVTVGKICIVLLTSLAAATCVFSFSRWWQEGDVKLALAGQNDQQWQTEILHIQKLKPFICNSNPAGSPMAWHEGIARFAMGNVPDAEAAFLRALTLSPFHLHVLYNLSICRLNQGDTLAAMRYLTRDLAISPDFEIAALPLAALYLHRRDFIAARKTLDNVSPATRSESWQQLNVLIAQFERKAP